MSQRTPYTSLALIAGTLALVLLAAWIYVMYASFSMKDRIASMGKTSAEGTAKESYLLSLKKTVLDARADTEAIEAHFIQEDGIPAFIDLLEKTAVDAGVKADLGSIALDEAADGSLVRTLRVRMAGSGTWGAVVELLSALESMPRALEVSALTVTKAGKGEGAGELWSFGADLVQYVVKQ